MTNYTPDGLATALINTQPSIQLASYVNNLHVKLLQLQKKYEKNSYFGSQDIKINDDKKVRRLQPLYQPGSKIISYGGWDEK